MLVRSASVRSSDRPAVARVLRPGRPASAANDDGDDRVGADTLEAALRHFAVHGLGAAREACAKAEHHWHRGDRRGAERWLAICSLLDKRLALALDTRLKDGTSATA